MKATIGDSLSHPRIPPMRESPIVAGETAAEAFRAADRGVVYLVMKSTSLF